MGEGATGRPELIVPALPRRGLDELLRGWNSDGQLFDALSAVADTDLDIQWTSRDVARRAARVLLEQMEDRLAALPIEASTWRENLPLTTTSNRELLSRPGRPTDWSTTARRFGWPPRAFVTQPRSRVQDETALRTLAWAAQALDRLLRDVRPLAPLLVGRVERPVQTLIHVVRQDLADVDAMRPDRLDLRSLAGSGTPWSSLAAVAEAILRAETDLEYLAFELIDPDLEWRLFHLSVIGEILAALRRLGGRVQWRAPLSAAVTSGPQFQVMLGAERWDLWFEAASAAQYYAVSSPYQKATRGVVRNQQGSIGADIMLVMPGHKSLSIECKWSPYGTYVGRDGYHQATAYAIEARAGIAEEVWSFVVGPSEIVPDLSEAELDWPTGRTIIGACSIEHLDGLIGRIVS